MGKRLLLLAAAFAAGTAFGYVLQPGPADGRAARRPATATTSLPEVRADPVAAEISAGAEPIAELPTGDGRILGLVVDDAGTPVADALVLATPIDPGTPRKWRKAPAGPTDEDLDAMARKMIARQRWLREGRKYARTAADGTHEITGLGPNKWTLHAYKEGLQFQPTSGNAYGAEPGATVNFTGTAIVRVSVDVRLADGSRPAVATILAQVRTESTSSTSNEMWLASEPWIELRPQPYELLAMTEAGRSRAQRVTIEAGKQVSLVFELESRPSLRVKVVPPEELAAITPEAMALRFAGSEPPEPSRLRREGMRRSDREAVLWQDLDPGNYLIGAAYSHDSPVAVTKVVEVRDGVAEHELRLPPVDPKEYLVVRALGPDGGSPGPLHFTLAYRSERRTSGSGANPFTRADGAHLLRRPTPEEESGGTYSIIAEGPLGRVEKAYDPADLREILLRFETPAYLDVAIGGYEASPHAGWLNVELSRRDAKGGSWRAVEAKPDPHGRCRLGPVQPGTYDVACSTIPESWPIAPAPIELRSGEQAATVAAPALHSLTVRRRGERSRTITIRPKDFVGRTVQREITGDSTTFERMPQGRYEVWVHGTSRGEPVEVNVPAQTEIAIE